MAQKTLEERVASLEVHMGNRVAELEKQLRETQDELKRVKGLARHAGDWAYPDNR